MALELSSEPPVQLLRCATKPLLQCHTLARTSHIPLTSQANENTSQTEDVTHHHGSRQLWGDGLQDREWHEVGEAKMLHIPHVEQGQAHTDCADDAGVVGGTLANLHEVISRDGGKRAEAQKRRQRGDRKSMQPCPLLSNTGADCVPDVALLQGTQT